MAAESSTRTRTQDNNTRSTKQRHRGQAVLVVSTPGAQRVRTNGGEMGDNDDDDTIMDTYSALDSPPALPSSNPDHTTSTTIDNEDSPVVATAAISQEELVTQICQQILNEAVVAQAVVVGVGNDDNDNEENNHDETTVANSVQDREHDIEQASSTLNSLQKPAATPSPLRVKKRRSTEIEELRQLLLYI
jgi:hypothetical protein